MTLLVAGKIDQKEAGKQLGVCVRQIKPTAPKLKGGSNAPTRPWQDRLVKEMRLAGGLSEPFPLPDALFWVFSGCATRGISSNA